MFEWFEVAIVLLLCVLVEGKELKCYALYIEDLNYCLNSNGCWYCKIESDQQLSLTDEAVTINGRSQNGSSVNVELVQFSGDSITKLPKIFQNGTNKQIVQVQLLDTNTRFLNSDFFGSCDDLEVLRASKIDQISVDSFNFQSCSSLKSLELDDNQLKSLPSSVHPGVSSLG